MLRMGLETTNRCQLNCLHCVREKKLPLQDLPIDMFDKLINQVRDFGDVWIGLTGGEPTMHPQFGYIIETLAKESIFFTMVTNGWNFKEIYPLFLKNKKTMPKAIVFSLDGATEKTHDRIRGNGSYRKIMQAISICRAKGIFFSLQMVVCSLNEDEMEKMCSLAIKLGSNYQSFCYPFFTPKLIKNKLIGGPGHREKFLKKFASLATTYRLPISTLPQLGTISSKSNYLFECCYLLGNTVNIDCRGNVTFCCNLSTYTGNPGSCSDVIGSLKNEDFPELYRKYLELLSRFKKDRLDNIMQKKMKEIDNYGCMYCARYFGKLDWIKKFPQSPWSKFATIK